MKSWGQKTILIVSVFWGTYLEASVPRACFLGRKNLFIADRLHMIFIGSGDNSTLCIKSFSAQDPFRLLTIGLLEEGEFISIKPHQKGIGGRLQIVSCYAKKKSEQREGRFLKIVIDTRNLSDETAWSVYECELDEFGRERLGLRLELGSVCEEFGYYPQSKKNIRSLR